MPTKFLTALVASIVGFLMFGAVVNDASVVGAEPNPASEAQLPGKPVDYTRDIKPILSNSCYACHGPDEGKRKAKLRLDVRDNAIKKAIKPGDPAASPLIERVASKDSAEVMPPPRSKKQPLSADQIDLLRRWVAAGAKFDDHWAYIKPVRREPPEVKNKPWIRNAIDQFVASEHEKRGFQPAPEADRITLVRRLSFDLLGLPPTPQEVDEFVNDHGPDAYEKLVDRLLKSRHFGERMAIYWLDMVRFADTAGYHSDNNRDIYPYRDYVIQTFNDNMPFDRFTIEQLAGDLLPSPTADQKIASGYNKLLMTTEEGGAQGKEYLAKYAADRVRNVSSVWLAGTMGCCECHNHKFDPYTTKDFYRFAAFFADIKETPVGRQEETSIPTPEQTAQLRKIDEQITAVKENLVAPMPELAAEQAQWEQKARADLAKSAGGWKKLKPEKAVSRDGATLTIQDDLSVLSSGKNPDKDAYTVTLATEQRHLTAIRLEALTHPTLTNKSLSRANGNFVLTDFEVRVAGKENLTPQYVKIKSAVADFEQNGFPVAHAIDNDPHTGWAIEGHVKAADHAAVFTLDQPIAGGPGTTITVILKHESSFAGHNIGRFRLAVTSMEKPSLQDNSLPEEIAKIVTIDGSKRTPPQNAALANYYRSIAPALAPLRDRIAKLEAEKKQLTQGFPKTLVAMAVPPRTMRVLPRGNWLDDSGDIISPAVPGFLPPADTKEPRASRLDLARWMVSRDNPMVARVFVNRLWKLMFGQGIVKSLDDFGTQGIPPTHPELLDWLALELMDSGWNVKHLLKLMALSSTYRQSSHAAKEIMEKDPGNQWLTRQGRFRIDAEMVRDNALAISGLLALKIGGPSVKPYQPAGYWALMNFPVRDYYPDKGENQYRRGLYTFWQRTFLHPSLLAFDAPTREECTVDRPRSSTPLQALVLLNDPTYVEAARVFAEHALEKGGKTFPELLDWAYRRAVSRTAKPAEAKLLEELYRKHLADYSKDKDAAKKLVSTGDWPVPKAIDPVELAAWTSVTRAILNLHETFTRN
ncbi:MAG: PSD1 and planctomycete cytochrome C domain-containing protein [Gemmataceae bacterium]